MIFLTVGSMFPFDRLVRAVDELVGAKVITEEVLAQIGDGRYEPRHLRFERFLPKVQYEERVSQATALIAHAGAGTIQLALAHGKPLLVLPRTGRFHEHVNDHQFATGRKFEELGHVLLANDVDDLPAKLVELTRFVPRPRVADRERVARRIALLIDEMTAGPKHPG